MYNSIFMLLVYILHNNNVYLIFVYICFVVMNASIIVQWSCVRYVRVRRIQYFIVFIHRPLVEAEQILDFFHEPCGLLSLQVSEVIFVSSLFPIYRPVFVLVNWRDEAADCSLLTLYQSLMVIALISTYHMLC